MTTRPPKSPFSRRALRIDNSTDVVSPVAGEEDPFETGFRQGQKPHGPARPKPSAFDEAPPPQAEALTTSPSLSPASDDAPETAPLETPDLFAPEAAGSNDANPADDPEAVFGLRLSALSETDRARVAKSHRSVRRTEGVRRKAEAQAAEAAPPAGDMNDLAALPQDAALAVVLFTGARDAQIVLAEGAAAQGDDEAAIGDALRLARRGVLAHLVAERDEILSQRRALAEASARFGFPTASKFALRPAAGPSSPIPGLDAANAALAALESASSRSLALAEMLGELTPAEAADFPQLAPIFADRAAGAQSEIYFDLGAKGAAQAAMLLAEARDAPDLETRLAQTEAAYRAMQAAAWDRAEAQRLRGRGWGGFLLESGVGPAGAAYSRSLSRFAAGLTGKALSRRSSALALAALFAATPEDAEAARFPIPHRQMLRAFEKLPALTHPDLVRRAGKPWGHHPVLDKLMERVGRALKIPLGREDHLTIRDDAFARLAKRSAHKDPKPLHDAISPAQNARNTEAIRRLWSRYGSTEDVFASAAGRTDFWRGQIWVSYRAMVDAGVPKRQAYDYAYHSFLDVFRQLHLKSGVRDIDAIPALETMPWKRR